MQPNYKETSPTKGNEPTKNGSSKQSKQKKSKAQQNKNNKDVSNKDASKTGTSGKQTVSAQANPYQPFSEVIHFDFCATWEFRLIFPFPASTSLLSLHTDKVMIPPQIATACTK
jgi:hypothetical protein